MAVVFLSAEKNSERIRLSKKVPTIFQLNTNKALEAIKILVLYKKNKLDSPSPFSAVSKK